MANNDETDLKSIAISETDWNTGQVYKPGFLGEYVQFPQIRGKG